MKGLKQRWWLLACYLLVACAATQHVESVADGCEAAAETAPFSQLCAEDSSLLALCVEEQCGVYRCREVAELLTPGKVVLARVRPPLPLNPGTGTTRTDLPPLPSPGPGSERYRGSAQGPLRDIQPVFIIPWGPRPQPELLPSQKQLLADAQAQRSKAYEGHHIYSRAFRKWFTRQGIDIDAYILPLEMEEHRRIHHGPSGGPWNAAWEKFIDDYPNAPPEQIHRYAGQLIYEFGLFGVILPYKLWRLQPPPVQSP
jgi:uncharacterized lipoprotein (TIGR02269 family)